MLPRLAAEYAVFFKIGVAVGGQYFRPQIAVIACRVAAAEDVAERLGAVYPVRFGQRRALLQLAADFVHQARLAAIFVIQTEIAEGKFELAVELAGGKVAFGGNQAVDELGRQGFAGLVVAGSQRQYFFVPYPVFQHLAGKFHRVPRYAVDAGYGGDVDLGEHLVQAVAEFVEQGYGFVVQKQVVAVGRFAEVAHDKRHGFLLCAVGKAAAAEPAFLPRAAAFAFAGENVGVKRCGVAAGLVVNFKKAHVGMPHRHVFFLAHADAVKAVCHGKQAGQDFFQREIRPQAFFIHGIALGFLFFGVIGGVPHFELVEAV